MNFEIGNTLMYLASCKPLSNFHSTEIVQNRYASYIHCRLYNIKTYFEVIYLGLLNVWLQFFWRDNNQFVNLVQGKW